MGIFPNAIISQAVILSGSKISEYITLDSLFYAVVALAVLFLIILIVYFINIKPNLNPGNTEAAPSSVDNAIAQIVENEEGELIGNYELVAVITAAIHASMGDAVPAGGFVVRSIRKANKR